MDKINKIKDIVIFLKSKYFSIFILFQINYFYFSFVSFILG